VTAASVTVHEILDKLQERCTATAFAAIKNKGSGWYAKWHDASTNCRALDRIQAEIDPGLTVADLLNGPPKEQAK
jgi:hypothetical protein